jgi:hypothetical protein
MYEAGESGSAIASRLNMKPGYGLDKLIEQANRHTWPDIRRAYALAIQAELDVKQGLIDAEKEEGYQLAVELYVQVMSMSPKRAPAARAGS